MERGHGSPSRIDGCTAFAGPLFTTRIGTFYDRIKAAFPTIDCLRNYGFAPALLHRLGADRGSNYNSSESQGDTHLANEAGGAVPERPRILVLDGPNRRADNL